MYNDNAVIVAKWPRGKAVKENWGDKLNPALIARLSGLPVVHHSDVQGWGARPVYRVIGSGLALMTENDVIWGTGLMDAKVEPEREAAKICAVRGPLTRQRLMELGFDCPEIYGDPALLYPLMYQPTVYRVYDYGLILHCRESGIIDPIDTSAQGRVLEIDIKGDLQKVVRQILSCEIVVSSSLHGIICAHAYGRPAYWLQASDLLMGDGFKFKDYFHSVGCHDVVPTTLSEDRSLTWGTMTKPVQPKVNGIELIESCPFMSRERKDIWISTLEDMRNSGKQGALFL